MPNSVSYKDEGLNRVLLESIATAATRQGGCGEPLNLTAISKLLFAAAITGPRVQRFRSIAGYADLGDFSAISALPTLREAGRREENQARLKAIIPFRSHPAGNRLMSQNSVANR